MVAYSLTQIQILVIIISIYCIALKKEELRNNKVSHFSPPLTIGKPPNELKCIISALYFSFTNKKVIIIWPPYALLTF